MEANELERRLRACVPTARLIRQRHLRLMQRILSDRGLPMTFRLDRPFRVSNLVVRSLGVLPSHMTTGPETQLVLMVEPGDLFAKSTSDATILKHYWQELFRAGVQSALSQVAAAQWLALPDAVRIEAEFFLAAEHLVPSRPGFSDLFAAFGTEFLATVLFTPGALPFTFPTADRDSLLSQFRTAIDTEVILQSTRPEGAMDLHTASATSPRTEVEISHIVPNSDAVQQKIEQARNVRNDVRAAILLAKIGDLKAARKQLRERLLPPLARILDWNPGEHEPWSQGLGLLLVSACRGYWSAAAKTLYDLQKIAVELDGELIVVDPGVWLGSAGHIPLKRPLTLARHTLLLKHLRRAESHLHKALLPPDSKHLIEDLLHRQIARCELALREQLRPIVEATLREVQLRPGNEPEQVAFQSIVAELLDAIVAKGHTRLSDIRDAIARNRLKLPDIANPLELLRGDRLLQADRLLAQRVDGIHHRGEFYLRLLQRFSSLAFGTRLGRFCTRFIGLPFGAAILVVEFSKYIAVEAQMLYRFVSRLVRHDDTVAESPEPVVAAHDDHGASLFTPGSLAAMLILGVFFLGLLHSPAVRKATGAVLNNLVHGLKWLFVSVPLALWNSRLLRLLRSHPASVFLAMRAGWPVVAGLVVGGFFLVFGASAGRALRWGGGTALGALILLNLPVGRRWQDDFEEWFADGFRTLRESWLPGLIGFLDWFFRTLLGALDRWLYSIDEWFRFQPGQSKPSVLLKTVLSFLWFPIAYVVRFAFYLLIEPQVNPVKHFPVVTVSHKLLLPMIPALSQSLNVSLELMTALISGVPGIFGFAVWELKENWRLYGANRPERLQPVPLGHHGETVRGLLHPGFHSGTIPKIYRRLRLATAQADKAGVDADLHKHLAALHHVEQAFQSFVERELIVPMQRTAAWADLKLHCCHVSLGLQRIVLELQLPERTEAVTRIEFQRRNDGIIGIVGMDGFVPTLNTAELEVWKVATSGLLAMGTVGIGPKWQDWMQFWNDHRKT